MDWRIYITKPLMKWREPKIKGMITGKNIVALFCGLLVISAPITFLCSSDRKFSLDNFLLIAGGLLLFGGSPFFIYFRLGSQIQLRNDAIIGPNGQYGERSAYKDIERIQYYRNCSYSMEDDISVLTRGKKHAEGPIFARFEIVMKRESALASVFSKPVLGFDVPSDVDLHKVLQILRDKGVNVIEAHV